jgi:hypothetical protein
MTAECGLSVVTNSVDICHQIGYIPRESLIPLIHGTSTGDSRLMERGRCLRVRFVTVLSGGPGIDPAGITTGMRGASLKRGGQARVTPSHFIA